MKQLISLSNCSGRHEPGYARSDWLQPLLARHRLDGIEIQLGTAWQAGWPSPQWVYGAALAPGECWLDFWRQDQQALLSRFGSEENIKAYYGGLTRDEWLEGCRQQINAARAAGARYLVFPVGEVKPWEAYTWQFGTTDEEVVTAAVEVINELVACIPDDMALLFENQWFPGLRLQDKPTVLRLIRGVRHPNIGIMLNTGHLLNTNHHLKTEVEGVEYILAVLRKLRLYREDIRGLRLNCSLSGEYVLRRQRQIAGGNLRAEEWPEYRLRIDEQQPFRVPAVKRIVYEVRPEVLVHHFRSEPFNDNWERKIRRQQEALLRPAERRRQLNKPVRTVNKKPER
ncbi:TIM barrel protein [Sporomusa termitida]|uniref:Xylose isomerase-like TIM barrel n=1 Tax=Sporomusa termitida TaxID=2377 RepID=A0A517DPN6_9FIRM|nr:TIM barrel protein [Sporomusa termitida]QDR79268.1 Xylose isomerase-like TIM barrel [Sporomusa termitida]